MATVTPGVLLTLLQSMSSDSKPLGKHPSAVLQVTAMVSAPSSTLSPDDLWPSHDFFIQLSDSLNSTYVYLSDRDAELIVSKGTQIGQLVHLDRLHFGLPVPLAIGIRPISPQRHYSFLGSPVPLIVIPSSSRTDEFDIQPASPSTADSIIKPSSFLVPRENSASSSKPSKSTPISKPKQLVSSAFRNPSPKVLDKKGIGGIYRSPCRFPSKCEVPSMVAASNEKTVNRARKPIIVPSRYRQLSPGSRYRQPSPGSREKAASPVGRKSSGSPGIQRLAGGLKFSSVVGDGGGKRKEGMVVTGISLGSDSLAGSGKPGRGSWDDSSSSSENSSAEMRKKGGPSSKGKAPMKPQKYSMLQRISRRIWKP